MPDTPSCPSPPRHALPALCLLLAILAAGCVENQGPPASLLPVTFNDPVAAAALPQPLTLAAARNETIHFSIQANNLPKVAGRKPVMLKLGQLQLVAEAAGSKPAANGAPAGIPVQNYTAYQVLPMPVDVNRAGFVRHTGLGGATRGLPRALLPVAIQDGAINLSDLRDPADPLNPASKAGGAAHVLLWLDLAIPPTATPGAYQANCDLLIDGRPAGAMAMKLAVHDFVLPDERHLQMVSHIDFEGLRRLWPDRFEAITLEYFSRTDPKYAAAVKTLDQLVRLAQAHRAGVVINQLQPVVKWPAGRPPEIRWDEYDSLVLPWLKGDAFPDKVPLGYWPLPGTHNIERYDRPSQHAYWLAAAAHFDRLDWLLRSAIAIEKRTSARASAAEAAAISAQAADLLSIHPRLRVSIALEEDQVHLGSSAHAIDPTRLDRLLFVAPGLVAASGTVQRLPPQAGPRWLRTDVPGLVPYVGAGADEREVRLWSWLAFHRNARLVRWASPLPSASDPQQPADPNELVWFYPGSWFGLDQPVPTVQLKWLRRAQQDYEYLWLARQRGQTTKALVMARLLTKPVEVVIGPEQAPDPTYTLMTGTTDPQVWTDALDLLARVILLNKPGQGYDRAAEMAVINRFNIWMIPQERPMLLGRSARWGWGLARDAASNVIDVMVGIDIYNAADQKPGENKLRWSGVPDGWLISPKAQDVPQLATYDVRREQLEARIRLDQIGPATRQPVEVTFTSGLDEQRPILLRMMLPVAHCDQREGAAPKVDGSLAEWMAEDSLHEGRLVRMLNRPAVQRQELQFASTPSSVCSGWTASHFYMGFKVQGIQAYSGGRGSVATNYADYQFRRAWGEDLCEVIVQPVYRDNRLGPVVHIICKPGGQVDVERKLDPRAHANPWQPVVGADLKYAATVRETAARGPDGKDIRDNIWRGELAIPWDVMNDEAHQGQRPVLLRFNFVQHRNRDGESASWAGPIDFGRDEALTGLLQIRASHGR